MPISTFKKMIHTKINRRQLLKLSGNSLGFLTLTSFLSKNLFTDHIFSSQSETSPYGISQIETSKICQLTGTGDRGSPDVPTGAEISGVTGGVTGTDLGYSFEYDNKLFFLFGDSREFPSDRCEPAWCGTKSNPIELLQPNQEKVMLWDSIQEWELFKQEHGDGWDSIATAPLNFNPENGIPLTFETTDIGIIFANEINLNKVGDTVKLNGQKVASNPQDKWILIMNYRILVITNQGDVFVHDITGNKIGIPFQLSGPKVAANAQDKWVFVMDNRILVITNQGNVFVHEISGNTIGVPFQLSGSKVAANAQDKWVFAMDNRIYVITNSGEVFIHEILGNTVGIPFRLSGPNVAANPQDKWVLVMNNKILVITTDGKIFSHDVTKTSIVNAQPIEGTRVADNPRDKCVLAMGNRILTFTKRDGIFRPTLLNGYPIGRSEGAFSAFTKGNIIYAFFSMKNRPPGCSKPEGCVHDDPHEPGGKTILSKSVDGGQNFIEVSLLSTVKFLWAVPVTVESSYIPGLPEDLTGNLVLVFGSGRENNDIGVNVKPWNHSFPFLALAPLSSIEESGGQVFSHNINNNNIGIASKLDGSKVAAKLQDKWVLVHNNRILVITTQGEVFVHEISGNTIGLPFQLTSTVVASNPQDKWVLVMNNRILVITNQGDVFVHEISGNTIGIPFQLSGPKVASNPQDKWVLVMNNRIVVITNQGDVFVHEIAGNTIGIPFQLSGPKVAAHPQDKWVIAIENRIFVITKSGEVFNHEISGNTIGIPFQLSSPRVAFNPQDKFVLAMEQKIIVITKDHWRYYAGNDSNNKPIWKPEESFAEPLMPFGSSQFGNDYHKSFGYFSVRFIESIRKWIMLYTCGNDTSAGYNENNGPRGIYIRTADFPWGPWSSPLLVFDPGVNGYCYFMHNQGAETNNQCNNTGNNPAEESVRNPIRDTTRIDKPVIASKRGWGGEYAPLLLPSRYTKIEGEKTTLYFLMSTWNPYQVVLMKTIIMGRL